jgi:hypothetical protein
MVEGPHDRSVTTESEAELGTGVLNRGQDLHSLGRYLQGIFIDLALGKDYFDRILTANIENPEQGLLGMFRTTMGDNCDFFQQMLPST